MTQLPPAEFIQDPDYTEHPSRSARIAGLCAVSAAVIIIAAALVRGVGS